jgi:uncharacterized short protein YbdD (DUF466 family)
MSLAHRRIGRAALLGLLHALRAAWGWLRTASGDDAYERYLAHCAHQHPGREPLGRRAFYRESERLKWSGVSRCC